MTFPLVTTTALREARDRLQREFPEARLVEARVEFRAGERHDGRPSEFWNDISWRVQVGNDSHSGDTLDEAIASLHKVRKLRAQQPGRAERIVAILREVPDEAFARYEVLDAARVLLERERVR